MNIKEFLQYKKENPEATSDFSFSVKKKELLENREYYKHHSEHDLMIKLCQNQKQKYEEGIYVPRVQRKNLKMFIS